MELAKIQQEEQPSIDFQEPQHQLLTKNNGENQAVEIYSDTIGIKKAPLDDEAEGSQNQMDENEVIMSQAEYLQVRKEFLQDEQAKLRLTYRVSKQLSEGQCTKFFCCCLKQKKNLADLEFH